MTQKAFITGVGGFSGSHMAEFLIKQGLKVAGLDHNQEKINNLKNIKEKCQLLICDLRQTSKIKSFLASYLPDYVFHFASPIIRSQFFDEKAMAKNLQIDLWATLKFLKILTSLPKKPKLLITGTNAEYQIKKIPLKENDPLYPQTPYGLAKLNQEIVSLNFCQQHSLPLFYTRTFHLFGPRQKSSFAISDFAKQIAEIELKIKKPILYIGNSLIKRDFTDVRDAVTAYWLIITKAKCYDFFNVCSQRSYSLFELVNFLLKQTKVKIKVVKMRKRMREKDPPLIIGNNEKLKSLGWQAKYDYKKTLIDTLNYWRKRLNT